MSVAGRRAARQAVSMVVVLAVVGTALVAAAAPPANRGGGGGKETTPDWGNWGDPVAIESNSNSSAFGPQVAVDPNGSALSVWSDTGGAIYANRFVAGSGWGTAEAIGQAEQYLGHSLVNLIGVRVGVDSQGNGVAVWSDWWLWSARFTVDGGWEAPEMIPFPLYGYSDVWGAHEAQVAVDPDGNAVAVWTQYQADEWCDPYYQYECEGIWASRFVAAVGWEMARVIGQPGWFAKSPQVGVDSSGNAIAVWLAEEIQPGSITVFANRFAVGAGWGSPEIVEPGFAGGIPVLDIAGLDIAMDPGGNATAVWSQWGAVWYNHFTVGAGWGTASTSIDGSSGYASGAQVAADASGNVVVVWSGFDGARYSIWVNRFVAGSGWIGAIRIEADQSGDASDPQLAMDAAGNAVVVWQQHDGVSYNVWANRLLATVKVGHGAKAVLGQWGNAVLLEQDNAGYAVAAAVGVAPGGDATAVWIQWDGARQGVWSSTMTG